MKTTKQNIKENTKSTKVDSMNLGRYSNYWYQHDEYEAFEKHHSHPVVMYHLGPNSYEIGEAKNKKEFIKVVHAYLNL